MGCLCIEDNAFSVRIIAYIKENNVSINQLE